MVSKREKNHEDDMKNLSTQYRSEVANKKVRKGVLGRTTSYLRKRVSRVSGTFVRQNVIPQEEIKSFTIVEELIEQGDKMRSRTVKIEDLDGHNISKEESMEDDCLIDEKTHTPIMRRRSSETHMEEIYDEDEEEMDENQIFYRKRDVLVQYPDNVDIIEEDGDGDKEPSINENLRISLTEEEQISGKFLLGQVVQTYWNDIDHHRVGFYTGIIKEYRIYNNDIQYEVNYEDGIKFWEIIDNGFIFLDEKMEEVKKQIIEIRKKRGTYSMVPTRRRIERSLRRRISSLTNGRKRLTSQIPQTAKKRKLMPEENNVKRRKILSMN